jgi:hypothetical protein
MLTMDFDKIAPWVSILSGNMCPRPEFATAVGNIDEEGMQAGVIYENFTRESVSVHVAVRKGTQLDRVFLAAIYDYPFNRLGVERVFLHVAELNIAAKRLAKHMGFRLVVTVPGVYPFNESLLIYRLDKKDCRFLNQEFAKVLEVA